MAIDKAIDSVDLDNSITTVANAIRQRGKTNSKLVFPSGMAQAILNIKDAIFLDNIKLTHGANKTSYYTNEAFNPAGMVVQANFNNSAYKNVSDFTYSPSGPLPKGTSTITISYTEQGINKTTTQGITVTDKPTFSWGSETAVGDINWWNAMRSWLPTQTPSQLESYVGKKKRIISNGSSIDVMCVGANCDRDVNNVSGNSLTFATYNPVRRGIYDAGGQQNWNYTPQIRKDCQNFYNGLAMKDAIATVSKGTSGKPNGAVIFMNVNVFIPSYSECGNTSNNASSNNEFCEQNTTKKAYNVSSLNYTGGWNGGFWTRTAYKQSAGTLFIYGSGSLGDAKDSYYDVMMFFCVAAK